MDELVYKAICDDRPNRLESFLRQGGDPNMWIEDSDRISAKSFLHVCCEKGRIRCVEILLKYGALADTQGSWGQSPLMVCIMVEYFDIAELLINNDRTIVDQQDSSGNTPLHIAINNDSVEAVELLIRHNADVNIMNIFGITPLMKICSTKEAKHMLEIARLLINGGANIDAKDFKSRRSALHRAVLAKNVASIEVLLESGADINSLDGCERTPLGNIVFESIRTYSVTRVIPDDIMTIIHILVMSGTNLNINTNEYSNPLVQSIQYKCTPLVNYFLVNGASVNGTFFGGITPLLHSVNKQDTETVKVLLNWTCDLNRKARMFKYNYDMMYDCFELAIHNGCPEIALLLAQAGYNISKVNYLTDLSSELPTCLINRIDILEQLREYVMTPPTLFNTAVMRIRHALRENIAHKSDLLPLPKLLIDDIKLRDVLV